MDGKIRLMFQLLFIGALAIYNLPLLVGIESINYFIPFSGWFGASLLFLERGSIIPFAGIQMLFIVSGLVGVHFGHKIWYPFKLLSTEKSV